MSVTINSMKFWINAFIPLNVKGYTKPIPGHPGKTMIPGPKFNLLSDCYHTDQRDFSNNIHASSRMHSEAKVDFTGGGQAMTQWHNCDETIECDCEDGEEECNKKGKTNNMSFKLLPAVTAPNPLLAVPTPRLAIPTPVLPVSSSAITLEMKCAAHNPCAPSSTIGGDIDYEGKIYMDRTARRIECDIKIDAFPAFEAYATINNGAGVMMFQIAPPFGNTVMDLPGPATRAVQVRLEDLDGDGIFEKRTVVRIP